MYSKTAYSENIAIKLFFFFKSQLDAFFNVCIIAINQAITVNLHDNN